MTSEDCKTTYKKAQKCAIQILVLQKFRRADN